MSREAIHLARKLRLGTRGSLLAMAQARSVSALLHQAWLDLDVEIVPIKTSGDRGQREQVGAFVHEIQLAVLDGTVDMALHCLKDLPTAPVDGLRLAAYLEREDPRDALIGRADGLAHGAVVGTGSVRRTSQMAAQRPDLSYKPLVGNIDTRLRKLMAGDYDAIVLAMAGLRRLGLLEGWSDSDYRELTVHPMEPTEMLPAPGQAVLVLETRSGDATTVETARALHHPPTQLCAETERRFLAEFGGGCSVPVAALATITDGGLHLKGLVASVDGRQVLRGERSASMEDRSELAPSLADDLGKRGAFELFDIPERSGP